MPYFHDARGRLHYRHWPIDRPAVTLALLPGIGQHSGNYHRFARALGAAGIELWTLDTSGHGLSEGDPERPGTLAELAADAHAFLAQIPTNHPKPLILMGHSLGAATALAVVAESATPFAGLVLCGTPKAVFDGRSPKSARGAEPDHDVARPVVSGSAVGPVIPVGLPVLLVHGVDDRRAPIDRVRQWVRQAPVDFREYADAGHDLLHEPVQARVTADIAEWIAAGPRGRRAGAGPSLHHR
ncbi:alpha/beta hydrolase [Nocardia uniformis]|uniref:Alpha/beta hydrolase n=1 Tax=Nocardia uniformis TaxID=53432 RepID=A0A849BXG8_9NOCA|nr:alpha/beta hydrolase [Nocardia uniformis]NNH69746.1 alpha/beta hydrolase [Nocardia uniformis]